MTLPPLLVSLVSSQHQQLLPPINPMPPKKATKASKDSSEVFDDQVFALSGTLTQTRDAITSLLEENGGTVASSVTKKVCSFLFVCVLLSYAHAHTRSLIWLPLLRTLPVHPARSRQQRYLLLLTPLFPLSSYSLLSEQWHLHCE